MSIRKRFSKKISEESLSYHKAPGEEVFGCFKALYTGHTTVDDGESDENIAKASEIVWYQPTIPKKVWVLVTDKILCFLHRTSRDSIIQVPLTNVVFLGFAPVKWRKLGTRGHPFGLVFFDKKTRSCVTHFVQLKSGTQVALPVSIKNAIVKAHDLHKKLRHYDQYLRRATADEERSQGDIKTGEVLSRFTATYVGSVAVNETEESIGQAAVHSAIQLLRAKLAQLYSQTQKRDSAKKVTGDSVVIAVSSEGIGVTEALSEDPVHNVILDNVCYTSVAQTDDKKELFAYLAEDDRLNRISCHIFYMLPGKAREICLTIGAAFQIATKEPTQDNAFTPISGDTDEEEFPGRLKDVVLNRNTLSPVKVIGSGSFGKVYLASHKSSSNEDQEPDTVAVKLLRGGANTSAKAEFLREASIMAQLTHENVASLLGVCMQHRPWLVVLEFIQFGDLREIFHACKDKSIDVHHVERLVLGVQIAAGMTYIISQRFCHRDLASRNCLLHTRNQLRIADFGLSRPFDDGFDYYLMREGARLSMKWTDPGGVVDKKFGEMTDMWSMGITLWEIYCYCEVPYSDVENTQIQRRLNEGLRLGQPEGCSDEMYAVMTKCWAPHAERWKFKDLEMKLREMYSKEKSKSPPRDIGSMLNSELSEQVRRMTTKVFKRKKSMQTAPPKLAEQEPGTHDALEISPRTSKLLVSPSPTDSPRFDFNETDVTSTSDGGDESDAPNQSRSRSAVFEELHISSAGDDGRIRMKSVSLAKARPNLQKKTETIMETQAELTCVEIEVEVDATNTTLTPIALALPQGGLDTRVVMDEDGKNSSVVVQGLSDQDQPTGRRQTVSFMQRPSGLKRDNNRNVTHTLGITEASTVDDVVAWFESLPQELAQYSQVVREKAIDGKVLLSSSFVELSTTLALNSNEERAMLEQALTSLKASDDDGGKDLGATSNKPNSENNSDVDDDDGDKKVEVFNPEYQDVEPASSYVGVEPVDESQLNTNAGYLKTSGASPDGKEKKSSYISEKELSAMMLQKTFNLSSEGHEARDSDEDC